MPRENRAAFFRLRRKSILARAGVPADFFPPENLAAD